jgi:hypothetical protein
MQRFMRDARGSVAIGMALAATPMIGIAGFAVDYIRASHVRTYLQAEADAAALGSAGASAPSESKKWLAKFQSETDERLGKGAWLKSMAVEGEWLSETQFRVTAEAEVPLTLLKVIPGISDHFNVEVEAVVELTKPKLTYTPPKVTDLDPEAADYNRIYVYCFNPEKKDTLSEGRSQETAIADNAGSKYSYVMPQCETGETLSYHLHNVREARTKPNLWDNPSAQHYEYYTDTVIRSGVEYYDLGHEMLETVLCDSAKECVGESQGGIIPEGTERTPEHATQSCEPGKFMYYGWEDRPPGMGWTDRDYNDIRIVIECPKSDSSGEFVLRLVK